ncbi:MAG TPA: flagellar biosynthesis protein FlhA [Pirellulales bacterium]|jgi:flagellar biosynthesis protein FlhA|nr:flagellar biosynthesis protein FlhA [Pirellulales bacterium]
MATTALPSIGMRTAFGRAADLALPVGLVASVLVILMPMPPVLMDVLLTLNIAAAVIMLLTTVYVKTPLEFNVFPSLLLATTLGRLVLNVATTRLILTRGQSHGLDAAGEVVRAFGEFVAGDKVAVGLVIFAILVVIQFVVITKGATRISEVAARFALDGLPGRQMAIDADVNAGTIDQAEARRRRAEVAQQADFFGAMDGASKFVRGDAIAGIAIIAVNIVGGLFIGIFDAGMSISQAGEVFTKLTIGDGLASQVPAFLISLAAGLLVTRSNTESNLPQEFVRQLLSRPRALVVTGAFLALLVLTNLPTVPLLGLGGACLALAASISRRQQTEQTAAAKAAAERRPTDERIENHLVVDPIELELGVGLLRFADTKRGGDLLERVARVRQNIAHDLGIIMPKLRIRDNTRLETNQYRIKLAGHAVAEATIWPSRLLAIYPANGAVRLNGPAGSDPASGAAGVWIEPADQSRAVAQGCRIVEPVSTMVAHVAAVVTGHASELLTRDAAKHLIDELRQRSPAVVDELIPGVMKLAEVQQVLQALLAEGVSIRSLETILETLGDEAGRDKSIARLTECVRRRLARSISARYRDGQNRLRVVTIDADVEARLRAGLVEHDGGSAIRMPPSEIDEICRTIALATERFERQASAPVVLVAPDIRPALKQITDSRLPQLVVLSYEEISADTRVESIAVATSNQQLATSNSL